MKRLKDLLDYLLANADYLLDISMKRLSDWIDDWFFYSPSIMEDKTNDEKWQQAHYRNGLRKWSAFPFIDRIALIIAVISLTAAILVFYR